MNEDSAPPPSLESSEPVETFRKIFFRYYDSLVGFFQNRGFSAEESADLAQETFLKVFRGLRGFRDKSSYRTWLFQIAANVYRNELRSRKQLKRQGIETANDLILQQGQSPDMAQISEDPLASTLDRERADVLAEALDQLPGQMRRCVLLRLHQGLKYREIAAVLNISISTVKAHLFQARHRLRKDLAGYFAEDG